VLAWVWLGLALVAQALALWLGTLLENSAEWAGLVGLALLVIVFSWAVPLTLGCMALLRGREYGWWTLLVHAALGCLVWTLLAFGGGNFLFGPTRDLLPLACAAMLVLSGLTVWWLLHDPPGKWT
jgi:hypothetical protein